MESTKDLVTNCLYDVRIPMHDGIGLAANIYFPSKRRQERFPAILNVTPYGKDSSFRTLVRSIFRDFAEAGYAVVHVDVRGRGNSEGEFTPYFQEIDDGHDCIEWVGKQKWCTGRVGTIGRSYGGAAQLYPMRHGSKYHRAAFVMCSPSIHPFHDCTAYTSGTVSPIMINWTMLLSGQTLKQEIYDKEINWDPILNIRPLKDIAKRLGLPRDPYAQFYSHETYDRFLQKLWTDDMNESMRVPCYFVSGWYDDSLKGALDHFPALTKDYSARKTCKNHKLLIGPWPHALSAPFNSSRKLGDFDYGPQSIVPLDREAIRWFDFWLKGIDNGVMKEPKVRVFLMGKNRWIDSNKFPLSSTKKQRLFLAADGPSNGLSGHGKLVANKGLAGYKVSKSTFTYNPTNPAPSPFSKEYFQDGTNEDLRPIQRRDDILVFTSAPVNKPLNIIGPVEAELFVSTSAVDTDFITRLSDVHPNGYAQRICRGISRLRYRDGYDRIRLAEPGEIVKIRVDMWGTGQQFQKEHCIRLEVTSSAFPSVAPNYNTGGSLWEEKDPIIANQTVYHSKEFPSHLILPEITKPRFAEAWRESRWESNLLELDICQSVFEQKVSFYLCRR
jgi:putative CocE/NonD family hydrolase